jgi:hypothetical protein
MGLPNHKLLMALSPPPAQEQGIGFQHMPDRLDIDPLIDAVNVLGNGSVAGPGDATMNVKCAQVCRARQRLGGDRITCQVVVTFTQQTYARIFHVDHHAL